MNLGHKVDKVRSSFHFKGFSSRRVQNSANPRHVFKLFKQTSPTLNNRFSFLRHSNSTATSTITTIKWELLTESDYSLHGDDGDYNQSTPRPPPFKIQQDPPPLPLLKIEQEPPPPQDPPVSSWHNLQPPQCIAEDPPPLRFKVKQEEPPLRCNKTKSLTTVPPITSFPHKSTFLHNYFGGRDERAGENSRKQERLEVICDIWAVPDAAAPAIDPNALPEALEAKEALKGKMSCCCSKSIGKIPLDEDISSASSSKGTKEDSATPPATDPNVQEAKSKKKRAKLRPLKSLKKSGKAVKAFGKTLKTGFVAMGKSPHIALSISPQLYDYAITSTDYYEEEQYYRN